MAKEVPEIDLILGGHDHILFQKKVGQTLILKSGCNFNNFSFLELDFGKINKSPNYEFEKYNVVIETVEVDEKYSEDLDLKNYVDDYQRDTEKQMEKVHNFFFFRISSCGLIFF